eukprot:283494-Prorocentrum_minimum.AAC.4
MGEPQIWLRMVLGCVCRCGGGKVAQGIREKPGKGRVGALVYLEFRVHWVRREGGGRGRRQGGSGRVCGGGRRICDLVETPAHRVPDS